MSAHFPLVLPILVPTHNAMLLWASWLAMRAVLTSERLDRTAIEIVLVVLAAKLVMRFVERLGVRAGKVRCCVPIIIAENAL
jgi:hypothetical protein